VPTCIILRGHTLLARIDGADAARLTKEVAQHAQPVPQALSKTDRAPAPPGKFEANGHTDSGAEKEEGPEALRARLVALMNKDRVVLFMKGVPDAPQCGFSRQTVAILRQQGVAFSYFDILTDDAVRAGLKELNEWPTFPQLIVNGEFVGGLDIIKEMVKNGEFDEVVKGASTESN